MPEAEPSLRPIGRVESPLTDPAEAPKQGFEGGPEAWLVLEPAVLDGLDGMEPGARLIVLTWLDRANRDTLRVHPRDDPRNPLRGVFSRARRTARIRSGCTRLRCARSRAAE